MYNEFKLTKSEIIPDVVIIEPDVFRDHRGFLYTDSLKSFYQEHISPDLSFDHSKYAHNEKHVLRGIHGDFESWKLVQCVFGSIYQVVVDNRPDSPTYMEFDSFELTHEKPKMILMPPGFGNAFLVTSEYAVYNYKLSYVGDYNDYDKQFTIKWNDPNLGISWPIKSPVLSNRDK